MKKNPNLSAEQKLVMFEDGTEPPGTSELNNEKREELSVPIVVSNYSILNQNMSGSGWPSFYDLTRCFETKLII